MAIKKSQLTVAVSVLMVAGIFSNSADATVELYKKGNLSYKLKGDWQVQLEKDVNTGDPSLDLAYDDLELKNVVTYELNNGMKAFGELHFSFDGIANDEATTGTKLEEAFLGIDFGSGTKIIFGKTGSAGDEFGVEKAYEKVGVAEDGFEDIADKGDDLIKLQTKAGAMTVITSTELEGDDNDTNTKSFFDVFLSTNLGPLEVSAAYMDYQNAQTSSTSDAKVTGFSASYKASNFDLGVDYSKVDFTGGAEKEINNVVAGFKTSSTTNVGIGFNNEDDGTVAGDVSGWYANITYKFPEAKNVRFFGEIGDNDKDLVKMGYVVGLRILL